MHCDRKYEDSEHWVSKTVVSRREKGRARGVDGYSDNKQAKDNVYGGMG